MKITRSDLLAVPTKNNTGSPTRPPLTGREKLRVIYPF